jgi:hypothetical protein
MAGKEGRWRRGGGKAGYEWRREWRRAGKEGEGEGEEKETVAKEAGKDR